MAMAEKQTHLHLEASIPRPSKSDHRRLNPIHDIVLIVLAVVAIIVLVGIPSTFIVLDILSPNNLKTHVTDASLTQFNLTTTNTLHYNLALNITLRNPNRRIGLYYDTIKANAYYEDQIFGSDLSPVFDGHQLFLLGAIELSKFNSETADGVYSIDVKLILKTRAKGNWRNWPRRASAQVWFKGSLTSFEL